MYLFYIILNIILIINKNNIYRERERERKKNREINIFLWVIKIAVKAFASFYL